MKAASILFFDIGGTVFDWETAIVEALAAGNLIEASQRRAFAWQCREIFLADSSAVRRGLRPWQEADELFSAVIDGQLQRHKVNASPPEIARVRHAWHNMPAWPEAIDAIRDLRQAYHVVPLSLLSWSMAMGSSRHNGISWDGLLTCDVMGYYKPDPRCFSKALELFKAQAQDAIMVASHPSDLYAAKDYGFQTAYVEPCLQDPGEDYVSCKPDQHFDYADAGFPGLTRKLLARTPRN